MNLPVPIPQIAGVPPALTQAVNNRLRMMQQSALATTTTAAAASTSGTATAAGGGGAIALYANGTLAIQADAAPAVYLNTAVTPTSLVAYVKTAPTGASVTGQIYAGSAAWATFTIEAAAASVTVTPPTSLAAGQNIRLAITGVGSTIPGSDLAVFIYY